METLNILGCWRFNNDLIDEKFNNHFLTINEGGPNAIETGYFDTFSRYSLFDSANKSVSGLLLNPEIGYAANTDLTSGSFTLAFWYKSTSALGYTRHAVTRMLEPYTAAVIAKSDNSSDHYQEEPVNCSFVVVEKAASSTKNCIELQISTDGTAVNKIVSNSYNVGSHLILITYDSTQQKARIDIDGYPGEFQNVGIMHSSISDLKINAINPNYIEHQKSVTGRVISELFLSDEVATNFLSQRLYTYGLDYIVDDNLSEVEFDSFAALLSQPSTINTNKIVSQGSTIYLARSNGELLKGEQKIWDNQISFESPERNISLKKSNTGTVTFANNIATINGAVITL